MPLLDEVPADSWDAFLACVPESNIFQSRALHQVYEKTTGFRPFVFGSESKGEMNALVSGAIVSYGPRTLARFASRALVVGGPIGDELSFPLLLGAVRSRDIRIHWLQMGGPPKFHRKSRSIGGISFT